MSAYMVVFVTAHNLDWLAEYIEKVPAIVRRHGGKYIAISKGVPNAIERVEGSASIPDGIVVFEFPSTDAINSFLKSPDYSPYRQARAAATESNIFSFENDANAPQFLRQ